jgi:hypothetical protein
MHRKLVPALLLTLPACVLDKDLGNGSLLTTDATTGDAGTTDAATGDEPTTGVPDGCPEGQPHLAPLWSREFDPPGPTATFSSGFTPIGRLADGRIAVAGNLDLAPEQQGVALVLAAPDGQMLGVETAALGDGGNSLAHVLAIGPDDQPVVLAEHAAGDDTVMKLTRFTSDMTLVSQIDLPFLAVTTWPLAPTLALTPDGPVVAGFTGPSESVVARLAPDTGVPAWQQPLAGPLDLRFDEIAVGPAGDVAVGGHADSNDDEHTLRLWRLDPAGALIWERVITVPEFEEVTALHFAPDDQIVALRNGKEFTASVDLVSVEVATGETRWTLTVAAVEDKFGGWAEDMHVDADRFTIPMSRSRVHHHVPSDTNWTEVRTVSFAGELLGVTKVPGVLGDGGLSWLRSVRGRCGELIFVRDIDSLQVTTLAP